MTLRSQLYLLQLEDYNLERFKKWRQENGDREVLEKKSQVKWTIKARVLFFLAKLTGSIETAARVFSPLEVFAKSVLLLAAKVKLWLLHRNLVTFGITGSWGKTTLKDQLSGVLRIKYKVYKTAGNNNSLLGVALNVFKIPKGTQVFVCEMGAYAPGEIKEICDLVHPKAGIVTAVGPMHLERFGSLEAIKNAKYELLDAIPSGGLRIEPNKDIWKEIGRYFQIDSGEIRKILEALPPSPHRQEIIEANGTTIIDDSYNSNPEGFRMALKKMAGRPKILVTPGVIELGERQFLENEKIAKEAAKICDVVIVVGQTNRKAWEKGCPRAILVADIDQAKKEMARLIKPGATVLLENDLPDHYL